MRRGLLLFVCSLVVTASLAAEDWRWQGTAASGRYGDFPDTGRFAASNSFPVESRVEVENTETGQRTTVFITRELDEAGLLMVLSPNAARELGMRDDGTTEVRVRRAERLIRPPRLRDPEAAFSRDPDRNPLAALDSPTEEAPPPPPAEQEPLPPTAERERPDPERLPAIPVPEDEPGIEEPRKVVELIPEPDPEPEPEPEPELEPVPEVELAPLREPDPEPVPPEHQPRVQPRFEITIDEDEFPYPEAIEPEDPLAEDLPEIATRPPQPVSPRVVPDEIAEPWEPVEPAEPPTEERPEPLPPDAFPPEPTEEIDRVRIHDELESGKFYVQLGAFRSREGAGALVARLDERLPSTVVAAQVDEEPLYRVYVGPLEEDEVGAALYTMRRRGYRDAFVTRP